GRMLFVHNGRDSGRADFQETKPKGNVKGWCDEECRPIYSGYSNPISEPFARMTDVTRILSAIEHGDAHAAEELLPLVYQELRRLAAQKLAQEKPGQTLQATALVHEAYLRLVDTKRVQNWNGRGHFFAAAAEAMRRILIDRAREKLASKRGG